jgi:hypothetical protein
MKTYGEVDEYIHVFLTSTLVGGEWSASRSGRSTSGETAPGIHWVGGWVGLRAGLDDMEKRYPARRYSLYRQRYPASLNGTVSFVYLKFI